MTPYQRGSLDQQSATPFTAEIQRLKTGSGYRNHYRLWFPSKCIYDELRLRTRNASPGTKRQLGVEGSYDLYDPILEGVLRD